MTGAVTEDATRPLPRQPGPDPATGPSRLPEARLEHVFERTADTTPGATAVEHEGRATSYADLDARANQLAHVLADRGVRPGARVALFLERSPETYVALLGALKAGAAFVPVDPESPADRLAYVADDAGVDLLLTSTALADTVAPLGRAWLAVDGEAATLDAAPAHRPVDRSPDDGAARRLRRPHRVRHLHVRLERAPQGRRGRAVEHHELRRGRADRLRRAPHRPRPPGHDDLLRLLDRGDLADLGGRRDARRRTERRAAAGRGPRRPPRTDAASASCTACRRCSPPSRATCPGCAPSSSAARPARPSSSSAGARPGRRLLNTYGPTEATVTATWCELVPDRPVTIGRPLPTYGVELLEARTRRRASRRRARSARSPWPGPASPAGTWACRRRPPRCSSPTRARGDPLYRTGDLGRWTADGEIEYLGRADAEVKVRGHRVDLGEIESVLLTDPEVGSAVVALDPGGGGDAGSGDLAAYVVGEIADAEALTARLVAALRERLPAYMIPATLDVLDELPTQVSGKVDRAQLPAPAGRRLVAATGPVVAAEGELEEQIAARVGRGVRARARRALGRGRLLRRARRPLPARRHHRDAAARARRRRQSCRPRPLRAPLGAGARDPPRPAPAPPPRRPRRPGPGRSGPRPGGSPRPGRSRRWCSTCSCSP